MAADATSAGESSSTTSTTHTLTPPEAHVQRTLDLLEHERETDLAQMSLLASRCPPKLLEAKGLAILNLRVSNISLGLGGKTLVELEHYMKSTLPSHSFRNGDTCEILVSEAANTGAGAAKGRSGTASKGQKGKEKEKGGDGSSTTSSNLQGIVYRVNDDRVIVALDQSTDRDEKDLDIPEKCRIQKLANTVTYDRMEKTMRKVLRMLSPSEAAPPGLVQVLFGLRQPSFTPLSPEERDGIVFLDENLNDSQRDAVRFAVYESNDVALIHGPPGTGKTSTLIECIRHLVQQDKRILVCSASNLAVDNILERLTPHLPSTVMSRIGHPARILPSLMKSTLDYQINYSNNGQITKDVKDEIESLTKRLTSGKVRGKERREGWMEVRELRKEYRKRENNVVSGIVKQAKVVLATCHGAGSRQLFNLDFDVLIVDEAAQALEAVCWIPILKTTGKLILAGDHLQLPPTIKSINTPLPDKLKKAGTGKVSPKTLEVTLFDRLLDEYGDKIKRLLNVQYRMNEKIMLFPSQELYSSKLLAHESVAQRLLADLPELNESHTNEEETDHNVIDDGLLTEPVIFYDTAGTAMYERLEDASEDTSTRRTVEGESKSNENEAEIVMKFIQELVDAGVPLSSIAVITPYNAQVALLASLIRDRYPIEIAEAERPETGRSSTAIECGSVDGFQGREKDVIILSLVRSNDRKEVGFLSDKRRLNVAMTRARRCLCVVGDSETVSKGGKFLKDWMDWLEENADIRVVE